jgi:hypothetical protein
LLLAFDEQGAYRPVKLLRPGPRESQLPATGIKASKKSQNGKAENEVKYP